MPTQAKRNVDDKGALDCILRALTKTPRRASVRRLPGRIANDFRLLQQRGSTRCSMLFGYRRQRGDGECLVSPYPPTRRSDPKTCRLREKDAARCSSITRRQRFTVTSKPLSA